MGGGAIFVIGDGPACFDFFAIPNFDADKVLFAPLNVATFFSPICLTLDAARTENNESLPYATKGVTINYDAIQDKSLYRIT